MAPVTTELKVLVKVAGDAGLDKLSRSLVNLGKQANQSDVSLKKVALDLKKVQTAAGPQSINSLRAYRDAWKSISQEVAVGSREFQVATKNAQRLQAQLDKAQPRAGGRFGGIKGATQIAGTVAGAGIFGGLEGAAGAGVGALFGGPGGAIVGAGIGAQVGQLRQALAGVAEYGAELNKLRIALRGVSSDQAEYNRALSIISQATEDFAIPQSLVTRQFTRLQASVSGAGGSILDTEKSFRGIVAAVRATGGSLADVDAALTATAQVFSKGKVSAEELRQQIGERLPGAFTLFADAIGKTPQELDKALENGEVSLQDFLSFAEKIFERYGETAQIIANAPESAGDRLKVNLEKLNEQVAPELTRLGAQFQTFASEAVKALQGLFDLLGQVGKELERRLNGPEIAELQKAVGRAQRALIRTDLTAEQRKLQEGFLASAQKRLSELQFIGPPAPGGGTSNLPGAGGGGDGKGKRDRSAERALRTRERAIQKAVELEEKLRRAIRDTALESNRVGETAREAIENQYSAAVQKAIDKQDDLNRVIKELEDQSKTTFPDLRSLVDQLSVGLIEAADKERDFEKLNLRLDELGIKLKDFQNLSEQAFAVGTGGADLTFNIGTDVFERQKKAIDELLEKYPQLGEVANSAAELMTSGFRDVIAGAKSAQEVFSNFLNSIAETLIQSAQKMIAQFISIGIARMFAFGSSGFNLGGNFGGFGADPSSALGGLGFADGGVFAKNNVVPFAKGGIVNKPTVFPFANGIGLMGEAGPEAIMPLRRGANGRLGVESNGGMGSVVVNVDASGTSVQGDDQQAGQLGRVIGAAVQAELVKQKRPGGLLAS